jgi:hypothetical protein
MEDNMRPPLLSLCWLCLLVSPAVQAQEKPKPTYAELLEQVKKDDPKADFLKLRMAFTETPAYNPYDNDSETTAAMLKAVDKKDHAGALALAEKLLAKRYVDLRAHSIAALACAELKKDEQAKFHRKVFLGLVQSILKSGDGKTPATAYVVISTPEEYVALGVLGIETTGQALVPGEKGQKFDRMEGVTGKKERVTVFFNVTRQFRWLEESLKKDK